MVYIKIVNLYTSCLILPYGNDKIHYDIVGKHTTKWTLSSYCSLGQVPFLASQISYSSLQMEHVSSAKLRGVSGQTGGALEGWPVSANVALSSGKCICCSSIFTLEQFVFELGHNSLYWYKIVWTGTILIVLVQKQWK